MERKGKQKKTARNVIIILCVVLVAVSIPVIMALRKSHSQPTPAETTPTPTAPPAEETVSATPSIELPPYGGYSFDNDELVQLSDCAFVGDSICSGLFVYDVLPKDMVVATGNVGIRSLREYTFDINGGTYTALEALKVIDPKYVIFSMGMNDINMTSEETYCQNYLSFLADTQAELPSAKLVLQVHDELIVECREEQAEAAARMLEEEMEQVVSLSVPLTAEAHWGKNWLEAKG